MISVCIPTYNGSEYLKACLDSVLAQTFTDFEVLVVDDQSSDASVAIAEEYAAADPRVRVLINEQNLGLVGNWNRCAELARGEWVKYVFQDDLISPDCLAKMLASAAPDTAMVVCRRDFLFEAVPEKTQRQYVAYKEAYNPDKLFAAATVITPETFSAVVFSNFGKNFVGEPTAVMLRRSVFFSYGPFNRAMIQACDLEYWTRIGVNCGMTYVPETLATFRVHGASTSGSNMGGKRFRALHLDELVMLHDYVFNPLYAPLRAVADRLAPAGSLKDMLAVKLRDMGMYARRLAPDSPDLRQQMMAELETMKRAYPALQGVHKLPFSRRAAFIAWKLKKLMHGPVAAEREH